MSSSQSGNTYTITINSGSGCTYSLPAGVTKLDSYLLVGGGGGGGGGVSGGNKTGGSGGRGGAISSGSNFTVPSGTTLTVTVGTGGAGGVAERNGKSGNPSLLAASGGSSLSAAGGNQGRKASTRTNNSGTGTGTGGAGNNNGVGDNGGSGTSNSISGSSVTYAGGGGGGSGGSSASASTGGSGGGGAGGSTGVGASGSTNLGGGGGGGGGVNSGTAGAGGAGGAGVVIFTYTVDVIAPTVTLAASAATSTTTPTIYFTVTGNEDIRCSDLTAADDFALSNLSISSIAQTSPTVCTITGLSTATAGGGSVVSEVSASGTFSIRDLAGNAATTLAGSPKSTTVTLPSTDSTAPVVVGVTSSTADGTYKAGDQVMIQVSFSEVVSVTGTPTLTLETGTTDEVVNYSSGTGSPTLVFTYTVQSGNVSSDLSYVGTSSLIGTIADGAGNSATLTLPSVGGAGSLSSNKAIIIDTTSPTVSSLDATTDATYADGEVVEISITFSEPISVSGTPLLQLETGTTDRSAEFSYSDGSTAYFLYTVSCGDSSSDLNITGTSALTLNGGSITDIGGTDAALTLPSSTALSGAAAVVISTTGCASGPTVSSVSSTTSAGSYKSGDSISIQVTFSAAVTVSGSPTLTLETGSTDRTATYSSTSSAVVTFTYTVQAGDTSGDLDYTSTSALILNGGSIVDASSNAADLTLPSPGAASSLGANEALVVDTTAPTISSFSSTKADGTYKAGEPINITATANEAIKSGNSIVVTLDTGRTVTLTASADGTTMTGTYTVQSSDTSSDLTVGSFTITSVADTAGNSMTSTSVPTGSNNIAGSKALVIDTSGPTLSSTSPLDNATGVGIGSNIVLTFNESVTAVSSKYIRICTGTSSCAGSTVTGDVAQVFAATAGTVSISGATVTINPSDLSTSTTYYIGIDSGAFTDGVGNSYGGLTASSTLNFATSAASDAIAPTISSVTSSTSNGSYKVGSTISIQVNFSESVTVTGTPQLTLETGATDRTLNYGSGSGTTQLTFTYTVQAGDTTGDLDYASTASLALNGGVIADAAGNNATLTLASPGAANSLGANKAIVIDTTAPTLSSSSPTDGATSVAVGSDIVLTFSETVAEGSGLTISIKTSSSTFAIYTLPSARVTFSGSTVTIDPSGNLAEGADYFILIDSGAITDAAGNVYGGISSSTTLNFTTATGSGGGGGGPTTTAAPATSTTASPTTTVAIATATTTAASTTTTIFNPRRISICHSTGSGRYVQITVDRNGLNGHGNHAGDIIPAPAGGCPGSTTTSTSTTSPEVSGTGTTVAARPITTTTSIAIARTTVPPGRISICHATGAGTYVQITIDRNGLSGHGDHLDDIIPAPADGCPYSIRQLALNAITTTTAPTTGSTSSTPTTVERGKITICHATSAGFHVEITVDRSGLNGHGDHEGDIIPAPASGCPTGIVVSTTVPRTTVPPGKITICHATAAGFHVEITVDRNGLNGHGDHEGDLIPAPDGGCPSRVERQSEPSTTTTLPRGKVAICHALGGGKYSRLMINRSDLVEHDEHINDIVPAPASGCPGDPTSSTTTTTTTIPCLDDETVNNLDESPSLTEGLKVTSNSLPDDPNSGTIKISSPSSGPGISLSGVESTDPNVKVTVKSSGVDYNKPITWMNEGYGLFCWKLEPFGSGDYVYTLPNPPTPPDARYLGLAYSTVVVKAGSLTTTDPNYQVNTMFYNPEPGTGVFADVNKNGISDPGGLSGGVFGDKSISHIVLCVGEAELEPISTSTTALSSTTTAAFLTTTTTINWSAPFCSSTTTTIRTATTITPSSSTSTTTTTSTTVPGSSTSTTIGSSTTTIAGSTTTTVARSTTTTTIGGSSSTTTTSVAPSTTTTVGGSTTTTTTGGASSTTTTTIAGSTTSTTVGGSTTTTVGGSTSTTVAGSTTTTVGGSTTTTVVGSSTTSTTLSGSTTTTVGGSTTSSSIVVPTTSGPGTPTPEPPIEFIVESQNVPESGVVDLVLTLTDGATSELVFMRVDVKNFSVVADSLPVTGVERWSDSQRTGWYLIAFGMFFMLIPLRKRAAQRR